MHGGDNVDGPRQGEDFAHGSRLLRLTRRPLLSISGPGGASYRFSSAASKPQLMHFAPVSRNPAHSGQPSNSLANIFRTAIDLIGYL